MGCGRVGSALAHTLDQAGHSVSVVDSDPASFTKLHQDFTGTTVTGIGFDRDTLVKAGIDRAHAFAAVSSGDNSNILAARVARETFGVENVVARIYDPRRAEVYQRLGIPTVASVAWQTDQILRRILPESVGDEWRDGSGKVALTQLPAAEASRRDGSMSTCTMSSACTTVSTVGSTPSPYRVRKATRTPESFSSRVMR